MCRLMRAMRSFLCDTQGLAAVEYAIMLSLLMAVCMAAIRAIGDRAFGAFTGAARSIDAAGVIGSRELGSGGGRATTTSAGGTRNNSENTDRGRHGGNGKNN
jgi:Flp pilus assembly pilin Flp